LRIDLTEGEIELPDEEMLADLVLRYMAEHDRTSLRIREKDEKVATTRRWNHNIRVTLLHKGDLVFLE
jgi:hypothetical protein